MDLAAEFRTITPLSEMAFRLAVASFCGMVLGIDREIRGKSAGLRTHMLVALSSAGTTLVTLEIFEMLKAAGHTDMDPLRIVQGLAQAIVSSAPVSSSRPGGTSMASPPRSTSGCAAPSGSERERGSTPWH